MKKLRVIKIYANTISELVNDFNENIIKEELNDYILHQCLGLSVHDHLTLELVGNISTEEQKQVKQAIQNYYEFHIEHYKNIDKYDEWIRSILFVLGIVFIFASRKFNYLVNEFLLIIGWLAIWELGYDILFEKRKRTRNYLRYKQIYSSKIEFSKEQKR